MAPKKTKNKTPSPDPNGIFAGISVYLVENGVQNRRLQVWKQKLVQMGATIEERLSKKVSHVFAVDLNSLLQQVDRERLTRYKGFILLYQWLVDSLSSGEKVSEDLYLLKLNSEEDNTADKSLDQKQENENVSSDGEPLHHKKIKSSHDDVESRRDADSNAASETPNSPISSDNLPDSPSTASMSMDTPSGHFKDLFSVPG
ncbi:hypothetical protein Dsin_010272 [Dipteronia sinensis]|uniref:BRCT domain-containing protein n=1 Tax=Dipteronia sinensis TaxID=43782 RepID=A0AAE0ASE4_9ROSI|nr:hypothetical protein Dsin_010272 [Dipteronia sinensis]